MELRFQKSRQSSIFDKNAQLFKRYLAPKSRSTNGVRSLYLALGWKSLAWRGLGGSSGEATCHDWLSLYIF